MTDAPGTHSASLSLATLERIDRVCLEFEAAWKRDEKPRVEDHLGSAQGAERRELLRELLLLDLEKKNLLVLPFTALLSLVIYAQLI